MPELHWPSEHFVPEVHVAEQVPSLLQTSPVAQTVQADPQCEGFDATQPPQSTRPDGQAHVPPWQVVPLPQTMPHMPQLLLSAWTSVQAPLHSISVEEQPPVPVLLFAQLTPRHTRHARPSPIIDRSAVFIASTNSLRERR
jgi:hypothetical protein